MKLLSGILFFCCLNFYTIQSEASALPCMKIKKACSAAGFKKVAGEVSAKDCMSKILKGESVSGVTIDKDIIDSCKEKHEK